MGGVTVKLILAVLVAGMGSSFQHGYTTGVVNAPQDVVTKWMTDTLANRLKIEGREKFDKLDDYDENNKTYTPEKKKEIKDLKKKKSDLKKWVTLLWSVTVSVYCVGGVIGGLSTSCFASMLGRRNGLFINNIFAIIAGIFMYFSKSMKSPEMLIVGRCFAGYNSGLNSGLCAMYLVEISPQSVRGAVGSIYQLFLTISILVSQICGLQSVLGNKDHWPLLFGLITIVGVAQMALLLFCPESPKYIFTKKGEDACKKSLAWLRGEQNFDDDLVIIKAEYAKEQELGKATWGQMCSQTILRQPLIISVVIMLAQQLSGINAVIYYSTSTFREAKFSEKGAQTATIAMGAMNIVMTVISTILVDLLGRKTLLLAGFGSMFVVTVFLTFALSFVWAALCVTLVILFVVCFAIGPGSIPWFLVGEFFTQNARPRAASLAVAVNWLANFCVGLTFLPIQEVLGPRVFVIFAILQVLFFLYIFIKVPETKNKTYEEISQHFQ